MTYRPEIDGLRAIAVTSVILCHAGLPAFSGGFIGVDVFFVISGYLITKIIVTELGTGTFSLLHFYERRARRILPALFVVMGISSVCAYAWMLPDDFENFGQSLVATALFSNNILLTLTSGYWDLASEFKPLLHTWSLSVEEQFYLLFPLLLLMFRRREWLTLSLCAILLISIIASTLLTTVYPAASFYLLHTRAWELLIGAFISIHGGARIASHVVRQVGGSLGLLLIITAVLSFDNRTQFPGFYALLPTAGAALVILFATPDTVAHRLLSNPVSVGIGLISYSAYLWHWPLFAFARIYSTEQPSQAVMLFLAATTLTIAFLSWRYVEQPFRVKGFIKAPILFASCLSCTLVLVAVGFYLHNSRGMPERMFGQVYIAQSGIYARYNEAVFRFKTDAFDGNGKPRVLVGGNSFARDFVNMMLETYTPSTLDLVYRDDFGWCFALLEKRALKQLYHEADIVVLAHNNLPECIDSDTALAATDGKALFYIGPKHFGFNMNWLRRLPPAERANQYNPLLPETIDAEERFLAIVPAENAISVLSEIVVDGRVPITDATGHLISPDRLHLTQHGAKYIGERLLINSPLTKFLAPPKARPSRLKSPPARLAP